MGAKIILRGIWLGVGALILNVAVAFLWVWFYSFAIAPGHDGPYYQAYAQRVAPFSGLIAGIPLLFLAGMLSARGDRPLVAAAIPATTYILLDMLLMAIGGIWASVAALLLSYSTKLAAALAGGWFVQRRRAAPPPQ